MWHLVQMVREAEEPQEVFPVLQIRGEDGK